MSNTAAPAGVTGFGQGRGSADGVDLLARVHVHTAHALDTGATVWTVVAIVVVVGVVLGYSLWRKYREVQQRAAKLRVQQQFSHHFDTSEYGPPPTVPPQPAAPEYGPPQYAQQPYAGQPAPAPYGQAPYGPPYYGEPQHGQTPYGPPHEVPPPAGHYGPPNGPQYWPPQR
ncbi:MAG: hypothetical protein J2P18_16420 [Nocardia sp.]|nr:hypothetical protein [Nocardia sp.]